MVLGLRTKTRRSPTVQLDYIIRIQEIKPWPPSQSLRSLRAVSIGWEHGEKNSGLTNQAVPSHGTGSCVGDGRIEFNESFRLPVTLMRELSIKGGDAEFQKNCIEFNLYEPRRDKTVKGQLLGTAIVDLADYGVVRETVGVSAPINCKRTYRNTVQPLLYLEIQPFERSRSSASSRDNLVSREESLERSHSESVSALMSEEYAEEAEVASFTTDDDVSSHSSLAVASVAGESNGSLSPQNKEFLQTETVAESGEKNGSVPDQFATKSDQEQKTQSRAETSGISSRSLSKDLSSDLAWITQKITSPSLPLTAAEDMEKQHNSSNNKSNELRKEVKDDPESVATTGTATNESAEESVHKKNTDLVSVLSHHQDNGNGTGSEESAEDSIPKKNADLVSVLSHHKDNGNASATGTEDLLETVDINSPRNGSSDCEIREYEQRHAENDLLPAINRNLVISDTSSNTERSKNVKSVRSSVETSRSIGFVTTSPFLVADVPKKVRPSTSTERRNLLADNRIQNLESRIKMLEGELREAAGIEVSLYSVVAEHGSSMNKVHAPARRLSRLYFHASKQSSKARRGGAARSVVSGLVLVAKACGNDVPRLTFWLSNTITLRVIVEKSYGRNQLPTSVGPANGTSHVKNKSKKSPHLKWDSVPSKLSRSAIEESFSDLENPRTFAAALEKVESWIFSRIIESIWWQTFTPHMQSGAANAIRESLDSNSSKFFRRTSSSNDQQQGTYSFELWKKAFRDACECICPVRAAGHDCGCLPLLPRLIMEQLVARLDVAMFNAILRESADDIPTDPIADPISDADVLPIPVGKTSFGAGAQLKNAIGNWSRWLTDLFGIDDDDALHENENSSENDDEDDERSSRDASSKSFYLLNALSDLMMLPKDMLLSRTIRKEVCPTFGPPLIRRVLDSFTPDEFCPDPIPGVVLEALNSEDPFDPEDHSIMNFPCAAAPIIYQPPSISSVASIFGERGSHPQLTHSGSSVMKKSQTSDDELDELDSPLKSIILDSFQASPSSIKPGWMSKENGSANAMRYQLLREVWMDSE